MASVHSFVGRRLIIMSPPLGPSVRIIPSNRRYRVILIAIVISNIRMLATATFNVIDSMFACPIVLHIGWVRSCCCCCSFCFLSFFLALSLPHPLYFTQQPLSANERKRTVPNENDWLDSIEPCNRKSCVCVCVCLCAQSTKQESDNMQSKCKQYWKRQLHQMNGLRMCSVPCFHPHHLPKSPFDRIDHWSALTRWHTHSFTHSLSCLLFPIHSFHFLTLNACSITISNSKPTSNGIINSSGTSPVWLAATGENNETPWEVSHG